MVTRIGAESPAVARAALVLETLALKPRTLSELSEAIGIPKSSLLVILRTLTRRGFIHQEGRIFTLGIKMFTLGSAVTRWAMVEQAFRAVAEPIVQSVLGETVHLGIRDGAEVVHIANVEGHKPIRYVAREGERLPANATALGKVLLAYLPEDEVVSLFPNGLPKLTPLTIGSMSKFLRQLRKIRQEGYAVDLGEVDVDLRCVATPIFDPNGQVIAAVAITAPIFRLTDEKFPEFIALAKKAGQEISDRLGSTATTLQADTLAGDRP